MPVFTLLGRFRALLIITCFLVFVGQLSAQQPELGDCVDRPTVISDELYVDNQRWCVERIIDDPTIEPMAFTALEIGSDGTLYATRPLASMVMAIRDTDGDELPDTMEVFAEGLTLPNGLAYHDDTLYVAGGANLYQIDADGVVETLVDDLPSGTGFWTGGITVGDDNRLYVAIGAPCENCDYDEPDRGVILSMALDGTDRQVVATGFRNPADVEFYRGELWTLDTSPRQFSDGALDELNLVEAGGWYGFPDCLGSDTVNPAITSMGCNGVIQPRVLFGSSATPTSLAAFPYDVLPGTQDTLIVVLSGEPTQINFNGFKVVMVHFDDNNQPLGLSLLIPYRRNSFKEAFEEYGPAGYFAQHIVTLSEQGWGIYPQQPLAVGVSPQGWIYLSITGGQIIALRPVDEPFRPYSRMYPIWSPMHPDYEPRQNTNAQGD